jgi:hypothetical protein
MGVTSPKLCLLHPVAQPGALRMAKVEEEEEEGNRFT